MTVQKALLGVCFLAPILLAGCGKSEKSAPGVTVQAIDATRLGPAFSSAPAEVQRQVDSIKMCIGDSDLTKALAGLEKLAMLPDLSEEQKKAVQDLSAQVRQKLPPEASQPGR